MRESRHTVTNQVVSVTLTKDEVSWRSADEIAEYLAGRIRAHPAAQLIALFDHLSHTRSLDQGQVADEIAAAQNVVFCFGLTIPSAQSLAFRPRSIGICETRKNFIISYAEIPMPIANSAVANWIAGLAA